MIEILLRIISFSSLGLLVYEFGFKQTSTSIIYLNFSYFALLLFYVILDSIKLFKNILKIKFISIVKLILPLIALMLMVFSSFNEDLTLIESFEKYQIVYIISLIIIIIPEIINLISKLYNQKFSPAIIFVGSFQLLIIIGGLLLMLPNSTENSNINPVDAFFTSTSAVCVTGLSVLDTGKDFTLFGQTIILVLIQLGGLGMLTLTSFFAYFFKGAASYQENLYLKDFLSSEQINGLLSFALKIVLFTLLLESIGAFLIFINLPNELYNSFSEKIYFSVFHSVSAFCNAGFSTLSSGFYEEYFRFNYNIHLLLSILFIVGGLGYSVIFNLFTFFKVKIISLYKKYIKQIQNYQKSINVITLNTKIVLYTTLILIFIGTVSFFIGEVNNTLVEHESIYGKIVTSFFGGTTPRTAGFNTIDMSVITMPTILILLLLMWIGASPASTGGGIKTSTFALAMLNIYSTITGKNRIEVGTREIPQDSVNRAFSIMAISLLVLGLSTFIISSIEKEIEFLSIAFECFSAYATVGLSLGITTSLSDSSKIVIIFVMFIGRVGAINILIGLLKQVQNLPYKYPKESVLIN